MSDSLKSHGRLFKGRLFRDRRHLNIYHWTERILSVAFFISKEWIVNLYSMSTALLNPSLSEQILHKSRFDLHRRLDFIPVIIENTRVLTALAHPNHLVSLSSGDSLACRLLVFPMILGILYPLVRLFRQYLKFSKYSWFMATQQGISSKFSYRLIWRQNNNIDNALYLHFKWYIPPCRTSFQRIALLKLFKHSG